MSKEYCVPDREIDAIPFFVNPFSDVRPDTQRVLNSMGIIKEYSPYSYKDADTTKWAAIARSSGFPVRPGIPDPLALPSDCNFWIKLRQIKESQRQSESEVADVLAILSNVTKVVASASSRADEDASAPTVKGLANCISVLLALAGNSCLISPTESTVDVNGDIRVTWINGDREAELVFTSDSREADYFRYSNGLEYGGTTDISPNIVFQKIREIMTGLEGND